MKFIIILILEIYFFFSEKMSVTEGFLPPPKSNRAKKGLAADALPNFFLFTKKIKVFYFNP
jgi:hypothetical protein